MDTSQGLSSTVSYIFGQDAIGYVQEQSNNYSQAVLYEQDARGDIHATLKYNQNRAHVENVQLFMYNAFGESVTEESSAVVDNPYRFAGAYLDSESGFYMMGARYYDPTTGQFIQKDTYGGELEQPATQNPYNYCGGNPVKYTDPTGHF